MLHVDTLWDYAIRYNNIVASGEHSRAFACYASELWRLGSVNAWILLKWEPLKNLLYLSVNVFSTKVLIGDTICTSPIRDWTATNFTWLSEPREGLPVCRAKGVPSFLSYFKTLSIGPAPGIEPATSHSAVKRPTDWVNPASPRAAYRLR